MALVLTELALGTADIYTPPDPPPAGTAFATAESGMTGSGLQTTVKVSPFVKPGGARPVLNGSDVSGIHISNDGQSWLTSNGGTSNVFELHVADADWSALTPGKAYAACGDVGVKGSFRVSTNWGYDWDPVNTTVIEMNAGNVQPNPAGGTRAHPRPLGTLIVQDPGRGLLYLASNQGLLRSADDGVTWATIALAGKTLTSLVMDPGDSTVLYVAAGPVGGGVWKITAANAGGTAAPLTGGAAPTSVYCLDIDGGKLFAAADTDGIRMLPLSGTTWVDIGGASVLLNTDCHWHTVIASSNAGVQRVLLFAAKRPVPKGTVPPTMYQGLNDGTGWVWTHPASSKTIPAGQTAVYWNFVGQSGQLFTGTGGVVSSVTQDPTDQNTLWLTADLATYTSSDGGTTWTPVTAGLGVMIAHDAPFDPLSDNAAVGHTDFVVVTSSDRLKSVANAKPTVAGGPDPTTYSASYGLDFDWTGQGATSGLVVGTGARNQNTGGNIFYLAPGATTWQVTDWSTKTGGARVSAVRVGVNAAGTRVILAVAEQGGLWALTGALSNGFVKVSPAGMFTINGPSKRQPLEWVRNSTDVWALDRNSGLWRSKDYGATWANVWSAARGGPQQGYIAPDKGDPEKVYVSTSTGVYRLNNAHSGATVGGGITQTKLTASNSGDSLAFLSDGRLLCAVSSTPSNAAGIVQSRTPDVGNGGSWDLISDAAYARAGGFPTNLRVHADNTVLSVATNGNGVIISAVPV